MDNNEKIDKIYTALVGDLKEQGLIGIVDDIKTDLIKHTGNKDCHSGKGLSSQLKIQWGILIFIFTGLLGIMFFILKNSI